uniref:Uncharacterized protein n=1 Tax=Tanacetum cinerariifolium TaxID=118510 RepID=A0A6L2LR42_TANCI|nr:hypothetical protein [Tanacetum cinerariifolium]
MHAYDTIIPRQVPIPPPIIMPPSPMLSLICNPQEFFVPEELLPPKEQVSNLTSSFTDLSIPSREQACILVPPSFLVYTPTPPRIFKMGKSSIKMHLKHHEKQIEDILNYLEELSFHRIEKLKERLDFYSRNNPQGYPSSSPVIYGESLGAYFMSSRTSKKNHQATRLDLYHLQLSKIQPLGGLPRSIEGNVTALKPQTLKEAINITQREVGLGKTYSRHGMDQRNAENTDSGKPKLTENKDENWAGQGAGFLWEVMGSSWSSGGVVRSEEEVVAGLAGERGLYSVCLNVGGEDRL